MGNNKKNLMIDRFGQFIVLLFLSLNTFSLQFLQFLQYIMFLDLHSKKNEKTKTQNNNFFDYLLFFIGPCFVILEGEQQGQKNFPKSHNQKSQSPNQQNSAKPNFLIRNEVSNIKKAMSLNKNQRGGA